MIDTATLAATRIEVILIAASIIGIVVVVLVLAHRQEMARRKALMALLAERRFNAVERPTREQKFDAFAPFEGLGDMRHGGKGIRWLASKPRGRGEIRIIEHAYTVSTGKSSHTVVNTCIAAIGARDRAAAGWPLLRLSGESVLDRLGERLGGKPDVKLDDDAFNRRWRVRCDDDGFAIALLSPEVQAILAQADSAEWWGFGGASNLICIGRRGSADPKTLDAMLTRLDSVIEAMPLEARQGLGL
jgi:hypothetical protein